MRLWYSPHKLQRFRNRMWLYGLWRPRSSGYLGSYLLLKGIKQKAWEGDAETPAGLIKSAEVHFKSVVALVLSMSFSQNFNFQMSFKIHSFSSSKDTLEISSRITFNLICLLAKDNPLVHTLYEIHLVSAFLLKHFTIIYALKEVKHTSNIKH